MNCDFWTKQLREPEREFEAATRGSDVDAAAKELQRAKAASPSALEVCSWLTSGLGAPFPVVTFFAQTGPQRHEAELWVPRAG